MNTTDRLAGDLKTEEAFTGAVTRQAQDPVAIPVVAEPASACPRGASAGTPSPARYPRPGAGEGTKTPAVGAGASPASTAGSRGLSGAEWRKAAAKAARRRPARATPKAAAKVTIPPAPATGAALTATATCLGGCDWTAGPGDPAEVDKLAERHTTKPPKHPTNVVSEVKA